LSRPSKGHLTPPIHSQRNEEGNTKKEEEDEKGDIMIVIEFSNPLGGLVKMGVFIEIERGGLSPF
jgi:hypothetical protein